MVRKAVIFGLILFALISSVQAGYLKLPSEYGNQECELISKDFQKDFGGSLVFIVPLEDNGAFVEGDYAGHFLNKIYIKGNKDYFYFDWQSQSIFTSKQEVRDWYISMTFYNDAIVYDLSYERPPIPIRWHYP